MSTKKSRKHFRFMLGGIALIVGCSDGPATDGVDGSGGAVDGSGGATNSGTGGSATAGGTTGSSGGSGGISAGNGGTGSSGDTGGASSGGASSGGATTGGSGGSGPTGECPSSLLGYATISGDGVSATTGGGDATPVRPTTVSQLLDYASDDTPRVIEIVGTFDVPRLDVASNKTIVGVGDDATIRGGIRVRGYKAEPIFNVILRNFRVDGATTNVDNDAVQLYFAHHVWLDHLDISDGPDGNLDMTHAVNWVTVSWTKFHYTDNYERPDGESSDHRFSSLLGHSDNNDAEDDGRLKISFHHNWWGDGVIERMPRVRFGQVHVFNNYFSSADSNYCVRAGKKARLLIEGNYFDGVNSPHEFNEDDAETAHITARNNTYDGTTGTKAVDGMGTALTSVPYTATIEDADDIPALVQSCAGPRP